MRALIPIADMLDEYEFLVPYYLLKACGYEVDVAAPERRPVKGKRGIELEILPNKTFDEIDDVYDVIVIPGGYAPDKVRRYEKVKETVRRSYEKGKLIVSICHGGWVLISAGIVRGKKMTGSRGIWDDLKNAGGIPVDEPFVIDGNIVSVKTWRELDYLIREFPKLTGCKLG